MAEDTAISWTTHTFNPWWGCTKVGPGCDHCYAESADKRYGGDHWGSGKPRRLIKDWTPPEKWHRHAQATGIRPWVFCASMADVFDNEVPREWRARLWDIVRRTPLLRWQFCTKRVGNAYDMLPADWSENFQHCGVMATVVTQAEADRDIFKLSDLKANFGVSWIGLSMEPILEGVILGKRVCRASGAVETWDWLTGAWTLSDHEASGRVRFRAGDFAKVDWVITGGESGPRARPANPAWFRSIRDQCAEAGTPFHHKQNGEFIDIAEPQGFVPDDGGCDPQTHTFDDGTTVVHVGRNAAGRLLDGRIHDAMPAFQFPAGMLL